MRQLLFIVSMTVSLADPAHYITQLANESNDKDTIKLFLPEVLSKALKPVKSERRRNRIVRNLDHINQKWVSRTRRIERRLDSEHQALKQLLGQNRFLTEQLNTLTNRVVEGEERHKHELTQLHSKQFSLMERVDELSTSQYSDIPPYVSDDSYGQERLEETQSELADLETKVNAVERYIKTMYNMINENSGKLTDNRQVFKNLKDEIHRLDKAVRGDEGLTNV